MRVILINRDDRPERLERMIPRLEKLGWPWTRLPAVVPARRGRWRTVGQRGCSLSHLEALLQMGDQPEMIVEDDCIFEDCAEEVVTNALIELSSTTWDMLYLGVSSPVPVGEPGRWTTRFSKGRQRHAYAVNPEAREGLARILTDFLVDDRVKENHGDAYLDARSDELRRFVTVPQVAWQEPGYSDTSERLLEHRRPLVAAEQL